MSDIWVSIIIGIIEGLTEFLPVSSTGHMILAGHLLDFTGPKAEAFEVIIQLGAILAIVVLYWKRVLRLFGIRSSGAGAASGSGLTLGHIAAGILPALILAFLFRNQISLLFMPETVVIGLVVGGLFMIIAEKWPAPVQAETMEDITYKQALFIGVAQCLSLWPGFSRSGATIAGGMLAGASRAASADFTFLMAVPIMAAASGYSFIKEYDRIMNEDLLFFAVGFVVSFVVALLAVAAFIKLVQKLKLTYFAYYRFLLAGAVLIYMLTIGFD